MVIKRGDECGFLRRSIVELCQATARPDRSRASIKLQLVRYDDIQEMRRQNRLDFGTPQFASLRMGVEIHVYPKPDKDYRIRVLGLRAIEQ